MHAKLRTAFPLLIVVLIAMVGGAQTDTPTERSIDITQIRAVRAQVAANTSLNDELRALILSHYDAAATSLETAAANAKDAMEYERERSGIAGQVTALQQEVARPERTPRLNLSRDPTAEQVEDVLARERSRLAAHRVSLRDAERMVEERSTARTEISQRLGTLDQELERLSDELRLVAERGVHPELKNAARARVLAKREEALSEIGALRASVSLLEDRGALIPLEVDLAQRRVDYSEQLVMMIEEEAHDLRIKEAGASLERVRAQARQLAEKVPELAEVAAETEKFAEMLWGEDGIAALAEDNMLRLLATRKNLSDLNRISELTRRKYQAFGDHGSLSRWWPDIPEEFPEPGAAAKAVQRLELLVPEAEHRLITLEQQRAATHNLNRRVRLEVLSIYGEEINGETARLGRELLAERRELLDLLNQSYGRYSNELVEHLTVSRIFLTELRNVERFLFSQIIWARSVPRPIIPRFRDMSEAFGWLVSVEPAGRDIPNETSLLTSGRAIWVVLAVGALLLLRPRLRKRRAALAERVKAPETDSFRLTGLALLYSILLAAPLPLILYHGGLALGRSGASTHLTAATEALTLLAYIAALFEITRQMMAPGGLAEAHFGWPVNVTRDIFRGLLWSELVSLPLFYVALQLGMAGARLNSPPHLQLYNNSLGRAAFIIALAVLGSSCLFGLRPERKDSAGKTKPLLSRRLSDYAFPTSVIWAFPVMVLATLVPATLAVFGYYITGMLLAYQMLRTLWLGVIVLILGGLLVRWRATRRPLPMDASASRSGDSALEPASAEAVRQVRQLVRFLVALVMAVGLYTIWSDALPMLQELKRVQIWPKVTLMERASSAGDSDGVADSGPKISAGAAGEENPPSTSVPGYPGSAPASASASEGAPEGSSVMTLWSLFEALFAGIITFLLARNVPGLVEVTLRRRTRFDSGARFAFSTLIRYAITIFGVSAVFSLLGISWSSIQWLAAALTFGLGFGLQEIVANFVSGLILLIERPVRVGDVVTVGTLMGKVKRIQIRATTITLFDRSEMIVPNKEFITTKLVNWTLSDSKRRIEIPLRVAFGSDLELVMKILVEQAANHPNVLTDPEPSALLLEFCDDAIKLELRFVVDFGKGLAAKNDVLMAIDRAFVEHGVDFALPRLRVDVAKQEEDDD